jgi:peptidoglycan/LPS O-acetylase OafA/YrhL
MEYRREIDGLRAIAVLPVILFHAGVSWLRGGFLGVDVFFVLSGYLITSLILSELERDQFDLLQFYERRARRILPALFVVMAVSSVIACRWILPDELKNFGQSLVATTLLSNNVLLAMTSGYWSLAAEFKPLVHTWSLGVEEQYYALVPLLLMLGWRYFRRLLPAVIVVLGVVSFLAAGHGVFRDPDRCFYLLPTRAWEIAVGSALAFPVLSPARRIRHSQAVEVLGILGLLLISGACLLPLDGRSLPRHWLLLPVLGAVLVIQFATRETIAGRLLGSRPLVGLGLISYSAYLWHQPLFAFARVYSISEPDLRLMLFLALGSLALAWLTWWVVERPFRRQGVVRQSWVWSAAGVGSAVFVGVGLHLHTSYGLLDRFYKGASVSISEVDKNRYNERVFALKKGAFTRDQRLKVLIVGNSFARDFVNMTTESFDLRQVEIIYRNDLGDCIVPFRTEAAGLLYRTADVIVFASGKYRGDCISGNLKFARESGKDLFYAGTKQFGYNLNWLNRLEPERRANQFNPVLQEVMTQEGALEMAVPPEHFIPLMAPVLRNGRIPVTDEAGRLLSVDRSHLTRHGASFLGARVLRSTRFGERLRSAPPGGDQSPTSPVTP